MTGECTAGQQTPEVRSAHAAPDATVQQPV